MKQYFAALSFQGKLLGTYLLVILLAVLIFVICYIQGVSTATSHHVEYMQQANEQKNMNLDIAMGNQNSLNLIHFIDNKSNIILHETVGEMSGEQRFERDNYLSMILRLLATTSPNVRRISIMTESGDFYSSVSQNSGDFRERMAEIISGTKWQSRSQRYYTVPYPLKLGDAGYSAVTVIHQMSDIGQHQNFAYLLVDLDFGAITEDFNAMQSSGNTVSSFSVFSGDEVIYNSRNAHINLQTDLSMDEKNRVFQKLATIGEAEDGYGKLDIGNVRCIAAVRRNEATGWYLVHYIPESILLGSSMESMLRIMCWGIGLLAAAGLVSLVCSRQVSKPIRKLAETMSQARQGQVRLYDGENTRTDEIGNLIDSYNAMGERINESIIKLYIAQLNQKQAELKMLQFQINPHFLYNALNTVTAIARLEDVDEIPAITESLSDMFRYSIKGDDFVTLKEEMAQVQNYLQIQSVRFPGRFEIVYEVPAELESCGVIKFILQPIVENSIHHAFEEKRNKDTLKISAEEEADEVLLISVYDDGCGMPPEQVNEINLKLAQTAAGTLLGEDGNGIGLANVNARLKNFYGQESGVTVASEPGAFTCIQMRLKIRNWGGRRDENSDCRG